MIEERPIEKRGKITIRESSWHYRFMCWMDSDPYNGYDRCGYLKMLVGNILFFLLSAGAPFVFVGGIYSLVLRESISGVINSLLLLSLGTLGVSSGLLGIFADIALLHRGGYLPRAPNAIHRLFNVVNNHTRRATDLLAGRITTLFAYLLMPIINKVNELREQRRAKAKSETKPITGVKELQQPKEPNALVLLLRAIKEKHCPLVEFAP